MPIGRGGLSKNAKRRRSQMRFLKSKGLASVKKEVKNLKKFVMKTIENKQQNFSVDDQSVLDIGYASRPSLAITQGTQDGDERAAAPNNEARVGNSVTLMRTQLNLSLQQKTAGPGS